MSFRDPPFECRAKIKRNRVYFFKLTEDFEKHRWSNWVVLPSTLRQIPQVFVAVPNPRSADAICARRLPALFPLVLKLSWICRPSLRSDRQRDRSTVVPLMIHTHLTQESYLLTPVRVDRARPICAPRCTQYKLKRVMSARFVGTVPLYCTLSTHWTFKHVRRFDLLYRLSSCLVGKLRSVCMNRYWDGTPIRCFLNRRHLVWCSWKVSFEALENVAAQLSHHLDLAGICVVIMGNGGLRVLS